MAESSEGKYGGLHPVDGPAAPFRRRVLVVHEHALLAEAVALGLRASGELDSRVSAASCSAEVLTESLAWGAHLVILDIDASALELVREITSRKMRVLVTAAPGDRLAAAAVALGADGFVEKDEPFEHLVEASHVVLAGRNLLSPAERDSLAYFGRRHLARRDDIACRFARLSPREREVLACLAKGMSAQEITRDLFLSLATVRTHIRAILVKLGVSSQLAAVALAHRYAFADPPSEASAVTA